eukprot:2531842-Amphidinium_carterae.1
MCVTALTAHEHNGVTIPPLTHQTSKPHTHTRIQTQASSNVTFTNTSAGPHNIANTCTMSTKADEGSPYRSTARRNLSSITTNITDPDVAI